MNNFAITLWKLPGGWRVGAPNNQLDPKRNVHRFYSQQKLFS